MWRLRLDATHLSFSAPRPSGSMQKNWTTSRPISRPLKLERPTQSPLCGSVKAFRSRAQGLRGCIQPMAPCSTLLCRRRNVSLLKRLSGWQSHLADLRDAPRMTAACSAHGGKGDVPRFNPEKMRFACDPVVARCDCSPHLHHNSCAGSGCAGGNRRRTGR